MKLYLEGRLLLTRNYKDFYKLHRLILRATGHHPGILIVRQDNDRKRDLTVQGIVRAIRNLLAARVPLADTYHILNQWR